MMGYLKTVTFTAHKSMIGMMFVNLQVLAKVTLHILKAMTNLMSNNEWIIWPNLTQRNQKHVQISVKKPQGKTPFEIFRFR